jgi:hypothetical protein
MEFDAEQGASMRRSERLTSYKAFLALRFHSSTPHPLLAYWDIGSLLVGAL